MVWYWGGECFEVKNNIPNRAARALASALKKAGKRGFVRAADLFRALEKDEITENYRDRIKSDIIDLTRGLLIWQKEPRRQMDIIRLSESGHGKLDLRPSDVGLDLPTQTDEPWATAALGLDNLDRPEHVAFWMDWILDSELQLHGLSMMNRFAAYVEFDRKFGQLPGPARVNQVSKLHQLTKHFETENRLLVWVEIRTEQLVNETKLEITGGEKPRLGRVNIPQLDEEFLILLTSWERGEAELDEVAECAARTMIHSILFGGDRIKAIYALAASWLCRVQELALAHQGKDIYFSCLRTWRSLVVPSPESNRLVARFALLLLGLHYHCGGDQEDFVSIGKQLCEQAVESNLKLDPHRANLVNLLAFGKLVEVDACLKKCGRWFRTFLRDASSKGWAIGAALAQCNKPPGSRPCDPNANPCFIRHKRRALAPDRQFAKRP